MLITLLLAFLFLYFQIIEYNSSRFTFSDRVFGSIFYFSTGFHGIHVFCGSIFLFVNYIRLKNKQINFNHHLGFEFSILY
jgi:cytochrome c oxidase subunit 3